jgi:hypothetical protein
MGSDDGKREKERDRVYLTHVVVHPGERKLRATNVSVNVARKNR